MNNQKHNMSLLQGRAAFTSDKIQTPPKTDAWWQTQLICLCPYLDCKALHGPQWPQDKIQSPYCGIQHPSQPDQISVYTGLLWWVSLEWCNSVNRLCIFLLQGMQLMSYRKQFLLTSYTRSHPLPHSLAFITNTEYKGSNGLEELFPLYSSVSYIACIVLK